MSGGITNKSEPFQTQVITKRSSCGKILELFRTTRDDIDNNSRRRHRHIPPPPPPPFISNLLFLCFCLFHHLTLLLRHVSPLSYSTPNLTPLSLSPCCFSFSITSFFPFCTFPSSSFLYSLFIYLFVFNVIITCTTARSESEKVNDC
jgi:hypothetical protein